MSLLAFGESLLRLTPPDHGRVESARRLDVHVGGAESNVAVAAQRLGRDAAWTSLLPDSPLADRIVRELRSQGVETLETRTDAGRVGTYYLETGCSPRGFSVTYDRAGAAVRDATPDALPLDRLRAVDSFVTSGITPLLSSTLRETVASLFETAIAADTQVVFDLNYRANLAPPDEARAAVADLLHAVDLLQVTRRDAATVLGREGPADDVARELADEYGCETAIVTCGAEGAVAVHEGRTYEQPAVECETVDPVGTGDAFLGGLLASQDRGAAFDEALEYAAATAALKRTIPGDVALVTPEDVAEVVDGECAALTR